MNARQPAPACSAPVRRDGWASALLVLVAAVTVLRATYIEAPHIEERSSAGLSNYQIVTILWSTLLLICWGVFVAVRIAQDRLCWRKTWFGIAAVVFIAAGVLSIAAASNRRAVVTDLVTLAAPITAAALLVQFLTSRLRIRLVLFLLLAVGAAAAAISADQFFSSNEALIADYERNPQAHLTKLGIEAGSLEQWMYEHRLYSKGVRGFLLTGNSAASFFLLAMFIGIGFCADGIAAIGRLKDKQQKEHTLAALICYALVTLAPAAGLAMTRSKGGIGAAALGLVLFAALALFGPLLWKQRRLLGPALALFVAAACLFTISYGNKHDRLPGGNSMLVRWQYWTSAARMTADHPLTGVGGGNFSVLYPAYKVPAASETVQDPHNWALSLLSQYGPLGLAAFIAAALLPLYKLLRHRFTAAAVMPDLRPPSNKLPACMLALSTLLMLFVRPFLADAEFLFAEDTRSAAFAYILLYLVPAAVFAGVFFLLSKASQGDHSGKNGRQYLSLALVCGVIAVLIHNLIDFAIFEPGIWGCLWLVIAILAATVHNESMETKRPLALSPSLRTAAILGVFIIVIAHVFFAVVGPLKAHVLFGRALTSEYGRLDYIRKSIEADPLSPDAAYKAAAMLAQALRQSERPDERLTQETLDLAAVAQRRDPANFKPLRLQADTLAAAARFDKGPKKKDRLAAALEKYEQALARYPGSDRLHFDAAQTAEAIGQLDAALAHYKAAVDIEDAYRAQFKRMYPEKTDIISRLGRANYDLAQSKIAELFEKNPAP